jgi:tetratricopeptide (TPR) repeat protein
MSFLSRITFSGLMAGALLAVNGCSPMDSGSLDEDKEPHFMLGKSRVNAMDYAGAVEAFTESLEVNPRSASAHFQLACLFDSNTKTADPAAAIYHYQQYLRLNPKAENAGLVKQHIESCKVQLASDVVSLPSTPAAQKQLEDLAEKNHKLQDEVDKWRAYYANQPQPPKTGAPAQNNLPTQSQGSVIPDDVSNGSSTTSNLGNSVVTQTNNSSVTTNNKKPVAPKTKRIHTVANGETLASIARKYNVTLPALQSANPGLNPKKMRVGQPVTIPAK